MLNRVQTVGTVNEFVSGTYKFKKIERKVNKKLIKWGARVAVTVVAGSFMLDLTVPAAIGHAMGSPEAIPVNAFTDKATDMTAEALSITVGKVLQPLIDVLRELAKPIAGIMVTWGTLRYMIGQKNLASQTYNKLR